MASKPPRIGQWWWSPTCVSALFFLNPLLYSNPSECSHYLFFFFPPRLVTAELTFYTQQLQGLKCMAKCDSFDKFLSEVFCRWYFLLVYIHFLVQFFHMVSLGQMFLFPENWELTCYSNVILEQRWRTYLGHSMYVFHLFYWKESSLDWGMQIKT